MDYLQEALAYFNTDKSQWYGWKKEDDNGNKIPNDQRMTYANIILNDSTATMPTKAEVDAKIQEIKDAEAQKIADKESANAKLRALGLTDDEIEAFKS